MYQYSTNPYIYHHGIKGMKWGVRRYQNKDGSLTPAGKARNKTLDNRTERKITKKTSKTKKMESVEKQTNASDGSKSKSKTKKAITIGTSVAAGLIASNLGSVPILNITGNLTITRVASATLGVIGGKKVYDLMNQRPSDNK